MNIAKALDLSIIDEEKTELYSFQKHVDSVVRDIPDVWDVTKYTKHPDAIKINYLWASDEIAKLAKYWTWKMIKRESFDCDSARGRIYSAKYFFKFAYEQYGLKYVNENFEEAWYRYVDYLEQRVRVRLTGEKNRSKNADGAERHGGAKSLKVMTPRTASQYASEALLFLGQIATIHENFKWVYTASEAKILPHELSKYFDKNELYEFRNKLIRMQFENKTKVIPYDELLEIMHRTKGYDHVFLRSAIIIAIHTGLRISEVRYLKIDCLEPVSADEIREAAIFREKYKIGIAGVVPDWSESYWLRGHKVLKEKKVSEWAEGTPIMVSKVVYKAVQEAINHSGHLRDEIETDWLFPVKRKSNGEVFVRPMSYGGFQAAKTKMINTLSLPHFKFHQLRATFATILYDLDIPVEMIQKYLNHVSVDMTGGYIASEHEREYLNLKAVAAGRMLGLDMSSRKVQDFSREVAGAVSSSEWERLDYYDHLAVFESIKKRHNITLVYHDHGFCMLPVEDECPHGFSGVKPCHLADCGEYAPDAEEIPTFIEMIQEREKASKDIEKMYARQCTSEPKLNALLSQRLQEFHDDTVKILNMVDYLKQQIASGE